MGLCLSPFLNIGAMLASFQSSGTWTVDSEVLNIIYKMGEISRLSSFKTVGVIESGPAALCGFRFERSFSMPGADVCIFGMEGCGLGPLSGKGPGVSRVNTELN